MLALVQCKAREAIPRFLADLESDDVRVRDAAYSAFRSFFVDFPPPFTPTGSEPKRRDEVVKVRAWYEVQKEGSR
jgi:hypothetical protein